ncbi:MAG: 50S ribosomal protein L10 [Acidobacteria bacterium]|nr:MAG: 50S ribosomal protein L10 [Acidobacteriota bacterium]
MKTREQKQREIELLADAFRRSPNIFLISFEGLSVAKDWELRRRLRQAANGGITYRVVKNRLAQKAAQGTPLEALSDQFRGMTAVALSQDDPVTVAKVLTEFAKENRGLQFKGAIVEGRVIDLEQVKALASLPSRAELLAQIAGLIHLQAQRIVNVINGVTRNLVVVLGQVRDQKAAE